MISHSIKLSSRKPILFNSSYDEGHQLLLKGFTELSYREGSQGYQTSFILTLDANQLRDDYGSRGIELGKQFIFTYTQCSVLLLWELQCTGNKSLLCFLFNCSYNKHLASFPGCSCSLITVCKYWRWEWPGNEANKHSYAFLVLFLF